MVSLRTDFYVFMAAPQCEGVVCRVLARRGVAALAPRTATFERVGKSRSRVWTSQPVFPGYVFASIRGPQWGMLRMVPYLHPQPLAMDGQPYRLTEADVAAIRALQEAPPADPRAPVAPHRFKQGDTVQILQGPFEGHKADVDADDSITVELSVLLFGRPTPYKVQRDWVRAA